MCKLINFLFFCVSFIVGISASVSNKDSLPIDRQYWKNLATAELEEALKLKWNTNRAKNIILFIGDGMGPNTVTSARIYKGGESSHLSFERFPFIGLLKTYSANKMVPDSASTASAIFTGVKVNQNTVGVDATVKESDCESSLLNEKRLRTLAFEAKNGGKSTGVVTTTRITHATPSAMYAHSPDRRWECEDEMATEHKLKGCKDIGMQLIHEEPGRSINVLMGGGLQTLVSNVTGHEMDPIDTWSCYSRDGRDLLETYARDKSRRGLKFKILRNNSDLANIDADGLDYVLGVFANGHLMMEHERDKGPSGMPSLGDMTEGAIKILNKNKNGFFLMVEGGNIDQAHHRGKAKRAVNEAVALDDAVERALKMVDLSETLFIVTSDHTHTLTINGSPDRGSNIFGMAEPSRFDGVNYTTLSYSTGGPGSMHYRAKLNADNELTVVREQTNQTDSFDYEQIAGIITNENKHGGGDVAIYATGPYSHLFHNVHEQNYVYHVICYAAKMGPYSSSTYLTQPFILLIFITALHLLI